MARRGKTQIGSGEREQSRLMLEAGRTGTAQRLGAGSELIRETARVGEVALKGGGQVGAGLQQYENRELSRDVETGRQLQARERQELLEAEAGYERVPGGPTEPLLEGMDAETREARVREGMDRGTAGAEQAPPGGAPQDLPPGQYGPLAEGQEQGTMGPPAPPDVSPRDPEQAMRLQQQGQQPVEMRGGAPAAPGFDQGQPGSLRQSAVGERRESRADFEANTARYRAETQRMQLGDAAAKAIAAGNEKDLAVVQKSLNDQMQHQSDIFSKLKNSYTGVNKLTHTEWGTIKSWADEMSMRDNPQGQSLYDVIETGEKSRQGPTDVAMQKRLEGFIRGYQDRAAMIATMTTGDVPGKFVTMGSPMMDKFQIGAKQGQTLLRLGGPPFTTWAKIKTQTDARRYINRFGAQQVLSGKIGGIGGGAFGFDPQQPGAGGGGQAGDGQTDGSAAGGMGEQVYPLHPEDRAQQEQQRASAGGGGLFQSGSLVQESARALVPLGLGGEGERPGRPLVEGGRVAGKQYEYQRGRTEEGEETGAPVKRGRQERVYGEKRQALREQYGPEIMPPEGEPTRTIGETPEGEKIFNSIPVGSDPDKWELVEAGEEAGKPEFGWIIKKFRERGEKREKARKKYLKEEELFGT